MKCTRRFYNDLLVHTLKSCPDPQKTSEHLQHTQVIPYKSHWALLGDSTSGCTDLYLCSHASTHVRSISVFTSLTASVSCFHNLPLPIFFLKTSQPQTGHKGSSVRAAFKRKGQDVHWIYYAVSCCNCGNMLFGIIVRCPAKEVFLPKNPRSTWWLT